MLNKVKVSSIIKCRNLFKHVQPTYLYLLFLINCCVIFLSSCSHSPKITEAANFGESYWDGKVALQQDCIIIGAGIVGLSTAIEIKKAKPKSVLHNITTSNGESHHLEHPKLI